MLGGKQPYTITKSLARILFGPILRVLVRAVNKTARLGTLGFRNAPTVLRIESVNDGKSKVLKLSGRIDEQHLAQLRAEIEKSGDVSKLDLRDVNLVDRSSVRFLMKYESQGIQLANCPLYVQEWISRERARAESRNDNE